MGRLWRIRDRATFAELRRHGRRGRSGPVAVTWLPATSEDPPRVAFSVGRRVGTAVVRNRLRRRLQAWLREHAGELAGGAYLVTVDPPAAALSGDAVRRALATALADATSRAGGGTQRDGDPVGAHR